MLYRLLVDFLLVYVSVSVSVSVPVSLFSVPPLRFQEPTGVLDQTNFRDEQELPHDVDALRTWQTPRRLQSIASKPRIQRLSV